jgi:small-conductance mechanosensitive channel
MQGLLLSALDLLQEPAAEKMVAGLVNTMLVLLWGRVAAGVGVIVFGKLSNNAEEHDWIQPATLPLYQFLYKVLIFGMMSYLLMAAWHVNLTSWLASAGVAGIALGFAAKDTLANFISGVFILGDAPYRVGEYIIIDGETRGMVTDIGMRSTRLLTRDNVEVTVPNAVIGNAKIVNESSGPSVNMRLRIDVGVAYGSDVDLVRELLLDCAKQAVCTSADQEPSVRFTAMGDSSLNFQVLVWVAHPQFRGQLIDDLNTRIYKALGEAGVQIPFPQRDLHIRSWPGPPGAQ